MADMKETGSKQCCPQSKNLQEIIILNGGGMNIATALVAGIVMLSVSANTFAITSCGKYVSNDEKESLESHYDDMVVLGFLLGAKTATMYETNNKNVLTNVDLDIEAVDQWILKYCKEHPLHPLDRAAWNLFLEMRNDQ